MRTLTNSSATTRQIFSLLIRSPRRRRHRPTSLFLRQLPALRLPVTSSTDSITRRFLHAASHRRTIAIFYQGGSTPGAFRRFTPESLFRFRPGGPIYAKGFCHLRNSERTLRIDRSRPA